MLLQTIHKHTDPGHPAYSVLQETARAAVDINCRINEYKRFREVGECAAPTTAKSSGRVPLPRNGRATRFRA